MPPKPKSREDTYVPPDTLIINVRDKVKELGPPYTLIYNVLISSGYRGREALYLVKNVRKLRTVELPYGAVRVHVDLQRGSKNGLVMYLPKEVYQQLMEWEGELPHEDTVEDVFASVHLGGAWANSPTAYATFRCAGRSETPPLLTTTTTATAKTATTPSPTTALTTATQLPIEQTITTKPPKQPNTTSPQQEGAGGNIIDSVINWVMNIVNNVINSLVHLSSPFLTTPMNFDFILSYPRGRTLSR